MKKPLGGVTRAVSQADGSQSADSARLTEANPPAQIPITIWQGCYERQWSGALIDDCFKHPAKFSRDLVTRILEYGRERGWWEPGMKLGDPFGGVGCGAVAAADQGYDWVGVELEKEFVQIGNRNIEAHREKWTRTGRPIPRLVQGDSRQFAETVAGIVTSPPFQNPSGGAKGIAIAGSSEAKQNRVGGHFLGRGGERDSSNIEKLMSGSIDAAVTSPPYETIRAGGTGLNHKPPKKPGQQSGRKKQNIDTKYGDGPGQISKTKRSTKLDGALTSPPHGNTMRGQQDGIAIGRRLSARRAAAASIRSAARASTPPTAMTRPTSAPWAAS